MSGKEIEDFNKMFEEFLEKIISKFPYAKLKTYYRGFKILKSTSPITPANLFMAGCKEYKTHIKQRDDLFFLKDRTVTDRAKNFGNFTEDCGLDTYWSELTTPRQRKPYGTTSSLFLYWEKLS